MVNRATIRPASKEPAHSKRVGEDFRTKPASIASLGNQRTQVLLRRGAASGQLEMGGARDPEEYEASDVAARIMDKDYSRVPAAPARTRAKSQVLVDGGAPLSSHLRGFFESRLGADLAGVRVHRDAEGGAYASALGARALADGTHIAFAPGQWTPDTYAGRHLLAHELAHVTRGHSGVRRAPDPLADPFNVSTPGLTNIVVLGDAPDPLARYTWLRDALGLEGWGALNDAARLRDIRQAQRLGGAVPAGDEPLLTVTARNTINIPVASLLQPRPSAAPGTFASQLFSTLRTGPIAMGGSYEAVRDEIARRWAARHEDIVRGNVEINLIDPFGALMTPDELLLSVAGVPVATPDGRLWISDLDAAISPGDLAAVLLEVKADCSEIAEAVALAGEVSNLVDIAEKTRSTPHDDVSANAAEDLRKMLGDYTIRVRDFPTTHPVVGPLLGESATAIANAASAYEPWADEHKKIIAGAQPEENFAEKEENMTKGLMKMGDDAPLWAKGFVYQQASQSAMSHGVQDLVSGGAVSDDVELRQAFRRGDVSIRGFQSGESFIEDRGIIVGSVNAVVMLATLGVGAALEPVTIGGQMAFAGASSAIGTGVVLTTQSLLTSNVQLPDPMAQQIWESGGMTPEQIVVSSLTAGVFGATTAGLGAWMSRGPNTALARQMVAESLQNPMLEQSVGPGFTARAAGPGVVEIFQEGQPGIIRFTVTGWEIRPGPNAPPLAGADWVAPLGTPMQNGPFHGTLMVGLPQGPVGIVAGPQGWMVATPENLVGMGGWGLSQLPSGAPVIPGVEIPQIPSLPGADIVPVTPGLAGPVRGAGPLFVDIQGGPALQTGISEQANPGAPTFLPSLVGSTPGASGVLLEAGDFLPGNAGITTTNARDLAMLRMFSQNLPQWPAGPGIGPQPQPWEWDPTLAFPTRGSTQVLTTPGTPGTMPIPQAFFAPIGGEVVPGVPRLIPIATGGRTSQADVARLSPSTHEELHGAVDAAYWRRPFALSAADPATIKAMGQEIARWLKPGAFLELRLLRAGDEAKAVALSAQIPDAHVVSVPSHAIASFARTGQRPPGIDNEQWAVLEEAAADIRGEFGALGKGQFKRLVRIYRGGGPKSSQSVLVVGAETHGEFDYAVRLQAQGQDVTVVNPITSPAGREFRRGGGNLFSGRVEDLPAGALFDVIREDFPVPIMRHVPLTLEFANARIRHLRSGGRWFVATESIEFANTLEGVVADLGLEVNHTVASIHHESTPTSPWLHETTKELFILIFTRNKS